MDIERVIPNEYKDEFNNKNLNKKDELSGPLLEYLQSREQKLLEIQNFDFANLAYTPDEINNLKGWFNKCENTIKESDGNLDKVFSFLNEEKVGVIKSSTFLNDEVKSLDNLIKGAWGIEAGVQAAFMRQQEIKEIVIKEKNKEKTNKRVLEELILAGDNNNGTIFLGKKPRPKSCYHEVFHAMQNLVKLNMDPRNKGDHLKREIEVRWALISLREKKLITDIDRLKYMIGKDVFGDPMLKFGNNDIEKEIYYFNKYRKDFEDEILKK